RGAWGGARPRKLWPGAGQDDNAVVAVAPDIVERLGQFAMRPKAPAQRSAIGMQRHQEDTVAPLEADALVFVGVVLELAHAIPPLADPVPRTRPLRARTCITASPPSRAVRSIRFRGTRAAGF